MVDQWDALSHMALCICSDVDSTLKFTGAGVRLNKEPGSDDVGDSVCICEQAESIIINNIDIRFINFPCHKLRFIKA